MLLRGLGAETIVITGSVDEHVDRAHRSPRRRRRLEVVVASNGTSTTGEDWQRAALEYAMTNVAQVATCAEIAGGLAMTRARQRPPLDQGYIDGRWVEADAGATFAVGDPATGESSRPCRGWARRRRAARSRPPTGRCPAWRSAAGQRSRSQSCAAGRT